MIYLSYLELHRIKIIHKCHRVYVEGKISEVSGISSFISAFTGFQLVCFQAAI